MNMPKEEKELLCQQVIEENEQRVAYLKEFLEGFPLDTAVNKAVALELGTAIGFIEQNTEKLRKLIIS